MALKPLESTAYGIGDFARSLLEQAGGMVLLLASSAMWLVRPPFRYREFLRQLDFVGAQSALLIVVTGAFTGMVSALQGYNALQRYGAQSLIGATVVLALTRELGPVIGALMVIARVGSAMTTELGAMRNTQQIDALSSMAVEPVQYLVVPRVFAATVCVPILALLFSFAGMVGAYVVAIQYLDVDAGAFMAGVRNYLAFGDITHGMVKALVFGVMLSVVACYQGFYMTGGARGAGVATTRSVVLSSVLVLVLDYGMTSLMFRST
jgi:phospholipid/cholesterol/gamma-HCH transport system permease protein